MIGRHPIITRTPTPFPSTTLFRSPAACRHRAAEPADAPLRHGECAHAPASGPCWTRHRDSGAPPAPRHSSAGTGTGPHVRETAARVAHRTLQWRGVAAVLARPWWTGLVVHRPMVDLPATSRLGEESRPSGRDEVSAGQPVALARPERTRAVEGKS